MSRNLIFVVLAVLNLTVMACASQEAQKNEPSTTWTGSMQNLKSSLSQLEPFLFDADKFRDSKNEKFVGEQLSLMALESKKVRHSPTIISRDPTVRFVASEFTDDLQRAHDAFFEGKKDFARYQIMKVTSYCVECHTRTQQGPEFSPFRIESFSGKMSVLDELEYLIAFRQFDKALVQAEKALSKADRNSPQLWQLDRVARLALQVAVQYKEDLGAANKIIDAVDGNKSLPFFLRSKVAAWKKSVLNWKAEKKVDRSLKTARNLVSSDGEIETMRGLSMLIQQLSINPESEALGESLLLTGQAYESLNELSPLALHENYFKACIRQVPHSKWSKLCFQSLEESVSAGYSGSSGTHIPVEVHVELEKLRQIAE